VRRGGRGRGTDDVDPPTPDLVSLDNFGKSNAFFRKARRCPQSDALESMGSSETRRPLPGGIGQWVAAMGYVIGAVALLKAAKGVEWRPARRRREDVSKRSGEKAHHAAPPAGPTSLPAAARPSSSKPAAEKEPDELPFPEPMPKGDLTQSALRRYDGSNASLPILLAAKGVVYDVTRGRDFYGAGGAYNLFTGRDCSRALAKMSLDPKDVTEDVSDLTADERKVLDDWVVKFEAKYPVVGRVEF